MQTWIELIDECVVRSSVVVAFTLALVCAGLGWMLVSVWPSPATVAWMGSAGCGLGLIAQSFVPRDCFRRKPRKED